MHVPPFNPSSRAYMRSAATRGPCTEPSGRHMPESVLFNTSPLGTLPGPSGWQLHCGGERSAAATPACFGNAGTSQCGEPTLGATCCVLPSHFAQSTDGPPGTQEVCHILCSTPPNGRRAAQGRSAPPPCMPAGFSVAIPSGRGRHSDGGVTPTLAPPKQQLNRASAEISDPTTPLVRPPALEAGPAVQRSRTV